MEASKNIITHFEKTKSFINVWLGVILTVLAMLVIFIVAALEGSREIRSSNSVSGMLLNEWREQQQVTTGFPEPYVTVIEHNNRDYYFVVNEVNPDTQEIISWYWAYDGGIGYVFYDYKHYVLVAITFVFSIFVSFVNYNSTIDKATKTDNFKKTLSFYKVKKENISDYTQYLPSFCAFKTKEAYIEEKQDIVESANLNWKDFQDEKIDFSKLEKWQKKRLKKIEKIKIVRLRAKDLLYEVKYGGNKIALLPKSQEEHRRSFLYKGGFIKFITLFMSGLIAGFGIIIGNWVLGTVFAFSILLSAIGAVASAADYAITTLRNRYIAKGELLSEFYNVKDLYVDDKDEKINPVKQINGGVEYAEQI